jgi:peptide/nickel transport system permease protein
MKTMFARWLDSDVGYSFRSSPLAMVAAAIALVCLVSAGFAHWIAPHNPFDLTTLELSDARLPPAWEADGRAKYLLGTDDQGRDILSAVMFGARISLVVGITSVLLSMLIGVVLGLLAGFRGGWIDAFLMRLCDVMLSFPPILVALLIAGVGRALFPNAHDSVAFGVLIISITLTGWVQYGRGAASHHGAPCATQCAGPGAGAGDHSCGHRHHHRGHAVFSGRGRAADVAVAGHLDPCRQ